MSKVLHCGDIMEGCDFVVRADSDEELLAKGAEHARQAHGIEQMSPEIVEKVKAAIREEEAE